jgi:hypothetical protein
MGSGHPEPGAGQDRSKRTAIVFLGEITPRHDRHEAISTSHGDFTHETAVISPCSSTTTECAPTDATSWPVKRRSG